MVNTKCYCVQFVLIVCMTQTAVSVLLCMRSCLGYLKAKHPLGPRKFAAEKCYFILTEFLTRGKFAVHPIYVSLLQIQANFAWMITTEKCFETYRICFSNKSIFGG
uniref:Uncharacterized protein n=1 Tax=Micrurus lemniscatus lemniscatus TaxID=129467 RepID=A0A2D4HB41_MICLE